MTNRTALTAPDDPPLFYYALLNVVQDAAVSLPSIDCVPLHYCLAACESVASLNLRQRRPLCKTVAYCVILISKLNLNLLKMAELQVTPPESKVKLMLFI